MAKVLQVRLDSKLKKDADKIFEQMGIDAPTAVRLFLKRVVITREIPFKITAEVFPDERMTPKLEKQIEEAMKDPEQFGSFNSMEEALAALNKQANR